MPDVVVIILVVLILIVIRMIVGAIRVIVDNERYE